MAFLPWAVRGVRRVGGLRLSAYPRPGTFALCALCVACGAVTVEYARPARGLVEAPITGRAWAPPCPAVQRLRDCLYRPFSQLRVGGYVSPGGDPGP